MGSGTEVIVVLDSNVLFSAMIRPDGHPYSIYRAWREGRFQLATCEDQLIEIRAAYRNPKLSRAVTGQNIGRLINQMRRSILLSSIPRQFTAADPTDAFLLDLANAAGANYLVTGDKRSGLLQRRRLDGIRILTPSDFCSEVLQLKP